MRVRRGLLVHCRGVPKTRVPESHSTAIVRQSVRMFDCCDPLRRDTCSEIPESHSTAMVRRSERTMDRCDPLRRSQTRTLARRYLNHTHSTAIVRRSEQMSGCCVPLQLSRLGLSGRNQGRSGRIRTRLRLLYSQNRYWTAVPIQ